MLESAFEIEAFRLELVNPFGPTQEPLSSPSTCDIFRLIVSPPHRFKLSITNECKTANILELASKVATGFLQKNDAEQLEIGLSFVHELASKMGGKVNFHSSLNGLVTVVFELKTANK